MLRRVIYRYAQRRWSRQGGRELDLGPSETRGRDSRRESRRVVVAVRTANGTADTIVAIALPCDRTRLYTATG